jgi:uncharacterized protein
MVGCQERVKIKIMRQEAVFFPCGALTLHGYCYYPDSGSFFPAVVLCHPHPLNGGSMNSSVIRSIGVELAERSIIAFMFNFRGVGKSQGSYGGGIEEQHDVLAAIDWLEAQPSVDKNKLGMAGYSFGGGVAAGTACKDSRIKALALISPYIESSKVNLLNRSAIPKYLITGDDDDLISKEDVELIFNSSAEPKSFEVIPGIDHFWFGSEKTLAGKVVDFLTGILNR